MSWTKFWFEGNQWWGVVKSKEDWEACVEQYKRWAPAADLRTARAHRDYNESVPSFGFYAEYSGALTLGEWARRNSRYGQLFG